MRFLISGIVVGGVLLVALFFLADVFQKQAEPQILSACENFRGHWVCERLDNEPVFNCGKDRLQGCCSGHGGVKSIYFETRQIECWDDEFSPTCSCPDDKKFTVN